MLRSPFYYLKKFGNKPYALGENISQVSHAVQCANWSSMYNKNDWIVLGTLFHDIGHLVDTKERMLINGVDHGAKNHDIIGKNFLKKYGVPEVCYEIVGEHVNAKRYLCTIKKGYLDMLSPASKETFYLQGGLMSPFEVDKFKSHKFHALILQSRIFDDLGKKVDMCPQKLSIDLEFYEKIFDLYRSKMDYK